MSDSSHLTEAERLRLIARRYAEPAPPDPELAGLWPEIRSRIERSKVVPIPPAAAAPRPARGCAAPHS